MDKGRQSACTQGLEVTYRNYHYLWREMEGRMWCWISAHPGRQTGFEETFFCILLQKSLLIEWYSCSWKSLLELYYSKSAVVGPANVGPISQ